MKVYLSSEPTIAAESQKKKEYLFSQFPTRRKESSICKVFIFFLIFFIFLNFLFYKLEKGNTDPDMLLGHKTVLRNKCTCGVFFCPSVHKGDQNHSLSIMQRSCLFLYLSPCYSSTKIMIVTRIFSTISPKHIRHLSLQLFTHFVPPSYTLYLFLH